MSRTAQARGLIAQLYAAPSRVTHLRRSRAPFICTSYSAIEESTEGGQALAPTPTINLIRSRAIRGFELRETLRYAAE